MSSFKLKVDNTKVTDTIIGDNRSNDKKSGKNRRDKERPFANLKIKNGSGNLNKKKKRKSNRYFYKVSNHHELFKIGRSYYTDYLAGVKSFAISSTGYQSSQQKTILGLASFFDHKDDVRIAIISDNLVNGAFKDIVSISKNLELNLFGDERLIKVKSFYNHFEFINLDGLFELSNDRNVGEYDDVFDIVVDQYDIVFWDVPELYKIQIDSERYFPMIMKFDSISIIVSQSISNKSDLEDLKKFFLGYGINLKGLLLEEKSIFERAKSKKEPWWKRIFGLS